jgi:hypothetical protein
MPMDNSAWMMAQGAGESGLTMPVLLSGLASGQ